MANDDITTQGPMGSPAGQALQRGMNFFFGAPKKGMVAPVQQKPAAQVTQVQPTPPAPVALPQPSLDTRSAYNVNTVVDRMVSGQ